jgi:hypothetical protein
MDLWAVTYVFPSYRVDPDSLPTSLGLPRGCLCLPIDLPTLTNGLTDTLTDAVPRLLILSGLSQHPYCTLSDPTYLTD